MFISVIKQINFNPQIYLFRTKLKRLQKRTNIKFNGRQSTAIWSVLVRNEHSDWGQISVKRKTHKENSGAEHVTILSVDTWVTCNVHYCGGNYCCSWPGQRAPPSRESWTRPDLGSDNLCTLSSKSSSYISCAVYRESGRG